MSAVFSKSFIRRKLTHNCTIIVYCLEDFARVYKLLEERINYGIVWHGMVRCGIVWLEHCLSRASTVCACVKSAKGVRTLFLLSTSCMYLCMYICVQYLEPACWHFALTILCVSMYMSVCRSVCMYIRVCVYVCKHVYLCVWSYWTAFCFIHSVCMCLCVYVWIFSFLIFLTGFERVKQVPSFSTGQSASPSEQSFVPSENICWATSHILGCLWQQPL